MSWKNESCKNCSFAVEAPQQGVPDLKAPKVYFCRQGPPNLLFAIAQAPGRPPTPMPMGSLYSLVDGNFPACSKFEQVENSKPILAEPNFDFLNKGNA